jgi:serine/threonine-protein kinase
VLCEKYRVGEVLGSGSMGVVMSAEHLQLGISVAIKALHPESRSNEEALARFRREACAAAHIRGDHVARVLDVGSLDDGTPFIVMERLEGEDLGMRLERGGPLPLQEAIDCVMQACEAVGEAHGLGIIHRDLKPQNLFCARRPDGTATIKVLDFGISKMPSMRLTETHACVGSPCYMSPEQLQSSRDADARSDVWSLGAVLYELLTGRLPFDGETMPELCTRILSASPRPMHQIRPAIPEELDAVVERALAKDRADRFANVAELAAALAPFGPPGADARTEAIARLLGVDPLAVVDAPRSAIVKCAAEADGDGGSSAVPSCRALTIVTAADGPAICCEPLPICPPATIRRRSRRLRRVFHGLAVAGIGAATAVVLVRIAGGSSNGGLAAAAASPAQANDKARNNQEPAPLAAAFEGMASPIVLAPPPKVPDPAEPSPSARTAPVAKAIGANRSVAVAAPWLQPRVASSGPSPQAVVVAKPRIAPPSPPPSAKPKSLYDYRK